MTIHTVTVCPDCLTPRITSKQPETISCTKCGSSYDFQTVRHHFTSESQEEAILYRGYIIADQQGKGEEYKQQVDSGIFEVGPETASKTQLEAVKDAFTDIDQEELSEGEILDFANSWGVDQEKTRHILNKMIETGSILEREPGVYQKL